MRAVVLASLLVMSVTACTPHPTFRAPLIQPTTDVSPEGILASFDQRWQLVEALRALARVTVTSAQGRYTTRQTFLWRHPALLRLDTLSLFGQPVMSLVADAAQVSIYYPVEGTFFQGPASAATLARVIRLPLDVEEVAPLLMGYPRPPPAQQVSALYLQAHEGMYLLRFLGGGGWLERDVWVDPEQWLPRRVVQYSQDGMVMVDLAYSDFRFLTDALVAPHKLTIWLPHAETEVRIQFLTIELNPELSPAVFHLAPPVGVRVNPLP